MDSPFEVVNVEEPEEAAWEIIGKGLQQYNYQYAGDEHFRRVCFTLRAADQTIVGGVLGEIFYDWLHIDLLWIPEDLRGQGYGRQLLLSIEDAARSCGAKNAFLDTFDFQAPDFYRQHGYRLYGELPGFPAGYTRLFFTKEL